MKALILRAIKGLANKYADEYTEILETPRTMDQKPSEFERGKLSALVLIKTDLEQLEEDIREAK